MNDKDRETVTKLHDIAFYVALHGLPFTQFEHQIKLEKLHNVPFSGAYENETACRNFILDTSDYLFEENMKKKLELVNFISILCDGSTDKSITEQEAIFVVFLDPVANLPSFKFFEVAAPENSQDAQGLHDAILSTFKRHGMESVVKRLVFLASDGASVNSGSNSGLISCFQEELPWVSFIWCFSHRLELSIKDALKEFMEPVETSLVHLYYLYTKSSKKHRELKNLYKDMKGQFEMYGEGVKPLKGVGTRWIDHKIRAMGRLVEKFGLYVQHLRDIIPTTKNSKDRATLQGKLTKLVNAPVLMRSAFFTDVLAEAKRFSMITQEKNINVIKMLDAVETTKYNYERLLKKVKKDPAYIFQLPNLKLVVYAAAESQEDENGENPGAAMYQNQKILYYSREKRFLEDHAVQIIEKIVDCFKQRYGNLFDDDETYSVNVNSDEGDRVLFDVARLLNCNAWVTNSDDSTEEEAFEIQLASLSTMYWRYATMPVFAAITEDEMVSSFLSIVRHGLKYYKVRSIDVIEFWSTIMTMLDQHPQWRPALLIIEICLCAPISNASLERLFSQMNLVKTTVRNRLSNPVLNALLRIRVSGITVEEFHKNYVDRCVNSWYQRKKRRLAQGKRKGYKKRTNKSSTKRPHFDISELSSESSESGQSSSENSDSDTD